MDEIHWGRALLNGLVAWFLGFVIFMIPALGYAGWIGFQLGSQAPDSATLSSRIGQEISTVYAQNWLLTGFLVVVTALLIFWRARAVARWTGRMRWANGLVVGAVPGALSLLFVVCGGFNWVDIVIVVIYLGVGVLGGVLAQA
jgi:hypothetical protein